MSKHTAKPWKAIDCALHPVFSDGITSGCIVAKTGSGSLGRANAQFIARAVNAHEDLLKAAKAVLAQAGEFERQHDHYAALSSAIKRAEGDDA